MPRPEEVILVLLNESMNLLKAPFLQERGWGEVSSFVGDLT
jgi:hypothetical protein